MHVTSLFSPRKTDRHVLLRQQINKNNFDSSKITFPALASLIVRIERKGQSRMTRKMKVLAKLWWVCVLPVVAGFAFTDHDLQHPFSRRGQLCHDRRCGLRVQTNGLDGLSIVSRRDSTLPSAIQGLRESLAAVRRLPRLTPENTEDPLLAMAVAEPTLPTFRRLFTHRTWKEHTGKRAHGRWWRSASTWQKSEIIRSISPTILIVSLYSAAVSLGLRKLTPDYLVKQTTQHTFPLSLAANAISLLLVFRTNNAYRRLEEARQLWGRVLHLTKEIVSRVVAASCPQEQMSFGYAKRQCVSVETVAKVCRYLSAFCWSLRDELRDGDEREDILKLLLPPQDEAWVARQRSRPAAIHGRLRRLLFEEKQVGRLEDTMHFLLEGDLKDLASVGADCERIFTSPIPPAMSRRGTRSVIVFFLAMPFVFAISSPVFLSAVWTFIIAFLFLGIEELGVQVEQPFQVIPLWQLCNQVQEDIEELVLHTFNVPTQQLEQEQNQQLNENKSQETNGST